jgi:hypothetical protein
MNYSGLRLESRKLKDFVFERSIISDKLAKFPLGRKKEVEKLSVWYQNGYPLCVICSLLFISEWYGMEDGRSVDDVCSELELNPFGVKPSKVLKKLQSQDLIPNYLYIKNLKQDIIEQALAHSPLMIGLWDWFLVPGQGHAMVLLDKVEDGWLCLNWMQEDRMDFVTLPLDTKFEFAVSFKDGVKDKKAARLGLLDGLSWKFETLKNSITKKLYG